MSVAVAAVDEQTGLSASQLTQPYFEIAVWMIGVDLQLPEMVTYGTKLAAHRLHVKHQIEIEAQKAGAIDMKLMDRTKTLSNSTLLKSKSQRNVVESKGHTTFPRQPAVPLLNVGSTLLMYSGKSDENQRRRTSAESGKIYDDPTVCVRFFG